MADQKPLKWGDVWRLARDQNSPAGTRALRETLIVLGISLAPLVFGALFAWIADLKDGREDRSWYFYGYYALLGGQLLLVFLALAGSNFARLWDPKSPRIEFAGIANGVALGGALLTAGLLGMDSSMSTFSFFPVNWLSVGFFLISIVHYYFLAVPAYIETGNTSETSRIKGEGMAMDLDKVPVK